MRDLSFVRSGAWFFVAASALLAAHCGGSGTTTAEPAFDAGATDATTPADARALYTGVSVSFGDDVSPAVAARVREHLTAVLGVSPRILSAANDDEPLGTGGLTLAFGATALAERVVSARELAALGPEGVALRGQSLGEGRALVARGNRAAARAHGNLGTNHAAYMLLEALGFGFLHPLEPLVPVALTIPASLDRSHSPRWADRAIHLHTQHPLELTDLLQGMGPGGGADEAGFTAMVPEWDRFLEWAVANGENEVEWFLLYADSWKDFADSPARFARLKLLVEHAHDRGLAAALDVPVAFGQQHAFRLVRTTGDRTAELAELRNRVDEVLQVPFDVLGTESGTSEFTSPDAGAMLAWLNELVKQATDVHGVPVFVKVHASTGQTAAGYTDPRTGTPLNFNFLPHFADPRLGVLPHTVQHYGLDDAAPTYGNGSFEPIRRFLHWQVGKRPVRWYPESAYWVSFDVDVPLFLPVYAERRLHDLRLLAGDEDGQRFGNPGQRMDGQLVFSSGWEWAYWLNDVVAARAAFDPHLELADDRAAFRALLTDVLAPLGSESAAIVDWLDRVAAAEHGLLIAGEVAGNAPNESMLTGQGYMEGWDTWDDVSKTGSSATASVPMTQPDKLGLVDMRNPVHGGPAYDPKVKALLSSMTVTFDTLASQIEAIDARVVGPGKPLVDELADSARITALRAKQLFGLYDYVAAYSVFGSNPARLARLAEARKALDDAAIVVARREAHYRVPLARVASWRSGPTAYAYGYLWTVHRLHYWWRDEGKAVDVPTSPCYLNIINAVDLGFGEGLGTDATRVLGDLLGTNGSRSCLAEPSQEPTYPPTGLRSRP